MGKSKWRPNIVFFIKIIIFVSFLQVLNYLHLWRKLWERSTYDEYNCGCPRYGPTINIKGNTSLCSDWSTSRGEHQKVISYSIYGDRKIPKILIRYYNGIEDRLKEASIFYKGWIVRLYHNMSKDDEEANNMICQLYCLYPNFDPCQINNLFKPKSWIIPNSTNPMTAGSWDTKTMIYFLSLLQPDMRQKDTSQGNNDTIVTNDSFAKLMIGKMWRFLPMGDEFVDDFLIRDVDSYILHREVEAVKQWQTNSSALIHAMRDHPSHNGFILAGMWGGSRRRGDKLMKSFLQQMMAWPPRDIWDYDQILLLRVVWPQVLDSVMVHDSYHCQNPILRSRCQTVPFPTKRNGTLFVGWGPSRSKTEIALIRQCPKKCRPKEHIDWTLC